MELAKGQSQLVAEPRHKSSERVIFKLSLWSYWYCRQVPQRSRRWRPCEKGVKGSISSSGSLLFIFCVQLNILGMTSFEETILLLWNIVEKQCAIPFYSFHHRLCYLFPSHHLTYCNHCQKTIKQFWTFCLEPSVCIILPIQMPFFLIILKTSWNFRWKTRRQQMNTMRPTVLGLPHSSISGERKPRKRQHSSLWSYPWSTTVWKYWMENSRNTQFVSFKLHAILSVIMKPPTAPPRVWSFPLPSAFSPDPPARHSVATLVIRLVIRETERAHSHDFYYIVLL